ncbi:hypothetical protein K469DRAFT_688498 [Zopfia rhizophila CBS 207.26]|uniref:Uncharacterized protein n=1 Tax=Zopfia rhizophila CBS 207.26 TaxID=1314779 RepID=A0A6A6DZC2_9PEZI|nr:hypothetical protein K469DRAFT_688498 [Zopfia rhizophila CBS 207.26]
MIKDKNGQTAGHLAVDEEQLETLRMLLSKRADFKATDNQERTARELLEDKIRELPSAEWNDALRILKELDRSPELYSDPIPNSKEVDSRFNPVILDFASGFFHRHGKRRELGIDVIVSGEEKFFKRHMEGGPQFRWLHLPANNMRWIELLMLRYSDSDRSPKRHLVLRDELWMERLHRGSQNLAHARYMRPMPYVHWEYAATFKKMRDYAQKVADFPGPSTPAEGKYQTLMQAYMTPQPGSGKADQGNPPETEGNPPKGQGKWQRDPVDQLHIRRSLDQYCYHALKSTEDRDKDQLVSRMFENGDLSGKPVLIMVDQLWLWVLGNDTVVTSFPERWSKEEEKPSNHDPLTSWKTLPTTVPKLCHRINWRK